MAELLITPHSDHPEAVAATEATLSMLPGGGRFRRDEAGAHVRRGGKLVLECSNPGFIRFAAVAQGYVRACEEPENPNAD